MSSDTWQGDAVGLVEAFRAGERSPSRGTRGVVRSDRRQRPERRLLRRPRGRAAPQRPRPMSNLPFGGVPIGVKELTHGRGLARHTRRRCRFTDRIADHTATMVERIVDLGGAVLAGQTTASEFGGVNLTRTKLHGATHNPWQQGTTPGGSSGGSASAVAGGIYPIATGGDGGGSIRIPAGFTGLVGLKGTFGRIPLRPARRVRQPHRVDRRDGHDRFATPHAGSTSPTATTPATRSACPVSMAGRTVSAHTSTHCAAHVSPSSPTGAVPSCLRSCGNCSTRQPTHLIGDLGLQRVDDIDTHVPEDGRAPGRSRE